MERISDDELIALIKSGDSQAEATLYDRYWGFAKIFGANMASIYKDMGFNADDFTNVAFTAVFIAIEKYKGYINAFYKYWAIVAKNECMTFIEENTYLNETESKPVSFDYQHYSDALSLHEILGENDSEIKSSITENEIKEYLMSGTNEMNQNEKLVAYYMIFQDYDYDDIVEVTGWSRQKAYRVVRKMKAKVSNFLKSGYFNS